MDDRIVEQSNLGLQLFFFQWWNLTKTPMHFYIGKKWVSVSHLNMVSRYLLCRFKKLKFCWCWILISGPCACYVGVLSLEIHCQQPLPSIFCFSYFSGRVSHFCSRLVSVVLTSSWDQRYVSLPPAQLRWGFFKFFPGWPQIVIILIFVFEVTGLQAWVTIPSLFKKSSSFQTYLITCRKKECGEIKEHLIFTPQRQNFPWEPKFTILKLKRLK
jgi:hypothetical protein